MNRTGQGRKRKPIEQHLQDGTIRSYHEPAFVPSGIAARPKCPAHLEAFDTAAPVLFDQVCTWLEALGTLSESDAPTIEAFVEAYYHHRKCLALLNGQYVTVCHKGKDEAGRAKLEITRNPLDAMTRHWLDGMNRYAAQLGLSPAARAALIRNAPPPKQDDKLETLFSIVGGDG
jgi:P27 family predicted phage terminase small subunit